MSLIRKVILAIIQAILFLSIGINQRVWAQEPIPRAEWDLPLQVPSPGGTSSWFPDLTVDQEGRVHVVWSESGDFGLSDSKIESAYYAMWDGSQWSLYNDIAPAQQDIIRTAITTDSFDTLHLLNDSSPPFSLYYKRASANDAFSAANWTFPTSVNEGLFTYMSDIVAYQDKLHVVYDDSGVIDDQCEYCADIYYRQSNDLGLSWAPPVPLSPTGTGSSRAQIKLDPSGALFVAWDEGWDRLTGHGEPLYGVFMYSKDGGDTWSSPLKVDFPQGNNVQMTVGNDGDGGIMLVWRTTSGSYPGIYYMWSSDWGENWTFPQSLPDIIARRYINPFDIYDMATDSLGQIHLLVVGNLSSGEFAPLDENQSPGLYHYIWNGENWSDPITIYEGSWYPEYPHLVISQGNQLHSTWFLRQDPFNPNSPHQVWYASGRSFSPNVIPTTRPVPSPTSISEPFLTRDSDVTPTPTFDPSEWQEADPPLTSEGLYTEQDDLVLLGISLFPALLLAAMVLIIFRIRRR